MNAVYQFGVPVFVGALITLTSNYFIKKNKNEIIKRGKLNFEKKEISKNENKLEDNFENLSEYDF